MRGCADQHGGGDSGQFDDVRRNRSAGIDECCHFAEHLATADLDGADLGDGVLVGASTCGLEVDDDKRRFAQRCVQLVEAQLPPDVELLPVGERGRRRKFSGRGGTHTADSRRTPRHEFESAYAESGSLRLPLGKQRIDPRQKYERRGSHLRWELANADSYLLTGRAIREGVATAISRRNRLIDRNGF